MTRLRTILISAALCAGVLAAMTESQAQGPGRGGGGGGRGGFGGPGGGFGGFGFFGGFGGNGIDMFLLQNEAVQKEIKLTDTQKTQIEKVRDEESKKRQKVRDAFRNNNNNNGGGGGGGGNNVALNDPTAGNGGGNNAGGNGGGRNRGRNNNGGGAGAAADGGPAGGGPGGGGPFGGGGPAGGGPFGGGGPGGGMDPAQWEAMREQSQAIANDTQAQLKKILTPPQVTRVQQISLQRQDIFAVARPDIAEKLNLSEENVQAVQEISQQMWGDMGKAMREQGRNRPNFRNPDGSPLSREERQKKMEEPEVKAQMEKAREEARQTTDQIRDKARSAVNRLLTKKQKATFAKMQGEKFDLALLAPPNGGGPFGRGPNGGGGANGAGTTKGGATPNNTAASTKKSATPAKTASATAKPATETAPAPAKKKSALSSRRSDD